jgi:hypothetical protein
MYEFGDFISTPEGLGTVIEVRTLLVSVMMDRTCQVQWFDLRAVYPVEKTR